MGDRLNERNIRFFDKDRNDSFTRTIHHPTLGVCRIIVHNDGRTEYLPEDNCSKVFMELEQNSNGHKGGEE